VRTREPRCFYKRKTIVLKMFMEERKQKEIEHYDAAAEQELAALGKDFEGFEPSVLNSYQFLYKTAASLIAGKKVLDYGCGNGVHSGFLAEHAAEVVGVDLSEASLRVARNIYKIQDTKYKIRFLTMDCEQLDFADNSFDVVFDGGTFSSLDFGRAMKEITRVLQPNGVLVGIETFGHNPIANANRTLNRVTGKRTEWASSHIMTTKEVEVLQEYFTDVRVWYFHIFSLFAFPLVRLPGGRLVLQFLQYIDTMLLRVSFLRKYSFKVVFVCKNPRQS
jgi:ubiquinone/menaquinone biosynthesis C-methylase UbiE